MPLINCPECQKQVSDKAISCPNCGHPLTPVSGTKTNLVNDTLIAKQQPVKKKSNGCAIITIGSVCVFSFIVLVGVISNTKTSKSTYNNTDSIPESKISELEILNKKLNDKSLTKQQKKEIELDIKNIKTIEWAKKNISSWDRSNPKLSRAIKKVMNDPGSFEHVSTTFEYHNTYVIGNMIYRGNNAFGAKIIAKAKGKFDYDGNLLEITPE
ncbi:MAG: zinc-ribbon domain-containing protein [Flavobacteriaceae bacterium]|jgi:hypothetical protein|nr:zinc-ribbon domain-containing protein [Flavobacteriaceae bacterium]